MAANQIRDAALHYIAAANLPTGAAATEDMLPDGARAQAVAGALATYSRLFPREISVAAAGPGATVLDLSDLTGWIEGVSALIEVEYPYAAATLGENTLHGDAWRIVDDPNNGKTLIFLEDTPAATAQVRYKFTGTHVDDTDPTSVRATHVDAVAKLAAANMALELASRTASHKEISVGASIAPNSTQSAYRDLARNLRKTALDDLGVGDDDGEGGVTPGTAIQTIDLDDYSSHGYGRLTHRRRRRY